MTIDSDRVRNWVFTDVVQRYDERDTMLYALSLGMSDNPHAFRFVYEGIADGALILPTFPVVLGQPGFWMKNSDTGIDWMRVVHGEQYVALHEPLPPRGEIVGRCRVLSVVDKGVAVGAVVTTERIISDASSGCVYATVRHVIVCRGDGGFGRSGESSHGDGFPVLLPTPDVPPEVVFDHTTRADTALVYRLLGDRNPLHADPSTARAAGYERPILHGLATYGISAAAVLGAFANMEPWRLKSIAARFCAPVYPGETLRTEMWNDGGSIRFRTRVLDRNIVVLTHGIARMDIGDRRAPVRN